MTSGQSRIWHNKHTQKATNLAKGTVCQNCLFSVNIVCVILFVFIVVLSFHCSLKRQFETIVNLWTSKQRKLRQNMIFATIKIIKSWDITKVFCFLLKMLFVLINCVYCGAFCYPQMWGQFMIINNQDSIYSQ